MPKTVVVASLIEPMIEPAEPEVDEPSLPELLAVRSESMLVDHSRKEQMIASMMAGTGMSAVIEMTAETGMMAEAGIGMIVAGFGKTAEIGMIDSAEERLVFSDSFDPVSECHHRQLVVQTGQTLKSSPMAVAVAVVAIGVETVGVETVVAVIVVAVIVVWTGRRDQEWTGIVFLEAFESMAVIVVIADENRTEVGLQLELLSELLPEPLFV